MSEISVSRCSVLVRKYRIGANAKAIRTLDDAEGCNEGGRLVVRVEAMAVSVASRRYHRRDFSVSGSNNVSGCRLYGVRPGTGECPVGSSDDARSPGATPVRTYISILTNHYYMPGEPRWAESTTNAHVAYLDQVYQQFTGARAL